MTVDHDGKIRMDCSSPYAMASLVGLKDRFDVAFGNDPDADRHGIVTPSVGLHEPEPLPRRRHPLSPGAPAAVAGVAPSSARRSCQQLPHRPRGRRAWAANCGRCRSASSGSRRACSTAPAASAARRAPARASCGATARSGRTDKDGLILGLLAAEITARTGKDPGEHYQELTAEFGTPYYTRIDAAGDARAEEPAQETVAGGRHRDRAAGEPITAKLTRAPGNDAPIGGLKVVIDKRLVRRPPVGNREHLQALCREPQKRMSIWPPSSSRPERSSAAPWREDEVFLRRQKAPEGLK